MMCFYHLYIFETCGHYIYSAAPIRRCEVSTEPNEHNAICPLAATHAYRSHRIYTLCLDCSLRRKANLTSLNNRIPEIHFEERRWKVSYRNPAAQQQWVEDEMVAYGTLGAEEMLRRVEDLRARKMQRDDRTVQSSSNPAVLRVGFTMEDKEK